MTTTIISVYQKIKISVLYDLIALSIFYSVPTLVHWFSFPLYYFDPMRLLVLSSILLTDRRNAYVLAFTLPVFAHFMGGHPSLAKSFLIGFELLTNVYLFQLVSLRVKYLSITVILSVIASKILYYLLKYFFIAFGMVKGGLITTPLLYQLIVITFIAIVFYIFENKSKILESMKK